MIVTVVAATLFGLVRAGDAGDSVDPRLMDKLNKYNLQRYCFGQEFMDRFDISSAVAKCEATETTVSIVPTPSEGLNVKEDVAEYVKGLDTQIGNLTCVLQNMKVLDSDYNFVDATFTMSAVTARYGSTPAGADPVFLEKLFNDFQDCIAVGKSIPKEVIERNPTMKQFGKILIASDCIYKAKDIACAKFQMAQYLQKHFNRTADVLPGMDKYDAAHLTVKAVQKEMTPERKLIEDFFWGKSHFL